MDTGMQNSPTSINDIEGATGNIRIDQKKAEAFGSRMLKLLNNGALTLMISLGHKTRLFETMAGLPPVTSVDLAKAVNLHERYVREWLATMYVGGIVTIENENTLLNVPGGNNPSVGATGKQTNASASNGGKHGIGLLAKAGGHTNAADLKYYLPPENAAFLTWGRGPENVAVLSQYISILSSFEQRVEDCFRSGRGIASAEYGDLKAIMAADSAQTIASSLVEWILPLGSNTLLNDLRAGIDVLDVQCGTGLNLLTMAKAFPKSWFTGYDDNAANISLAREAAGRDQLHNVRFKCVRMTESMETAAFDLITCFGSLIDTGDIFNVVQRIYVSLRPVGTFLLQDVAASSNTKDNLNHPAGPLLYTISLMYSVPAVLHKTNSEEDAVGVMWGNDKALNVIRGAGFKCDRPCYLPEDHCNAFFFCRKD